LKQPLHLTTTVDNKNNSSNKAPGKGNKKKSKVPASKAGGSNQPLTIDGSAAGVLALEARLAKVVPQNWVQLQDCEAMLTSLCSAKANEWL
jgi:hypothetical protein